MMKILDWKREQPLRAKVSFTREEAKMITKDFDSLPVGAESKVYKLSHSKKK